jgi:hypothetical protein
MTTPDLGGLFVNFPQCPYDKQYASAPVWRYNRRLNNIGYLPEHNQTAVMENDRNILPDAFRLEQNYPNPFNPSTKIKYSIPEKTNVKITIYNLLGQEIKTLVNDLHEAGNYTVTWDGTDNKGIKSATGIYFYSIKAGNYSKSKKMVLIK